MKLLKAALLCCFLANSLSLNAQELTEKNTLILFGMVNEFSAANVKYGLTTLRKESPKEPIYLVIHSNGGEMLAGLALANLVSMDSNVHAIVIWAASAAAGISQAMGGQVLITKNGKFLFHEVRYMVNSPFILQNDAKRMLEGLEKDNKKFAKVCNKRMCLADYAKRVKDDWIFGASEAIKLKAADKINDIKCSKEILEANLRVPLFDPISGNPEPVNFCNLL